MKYSCYSFRRKLLVTAVSFPGTPDFTSRDGALSKLDSVLIDHISNGHSALQYQFLQGVIPELKMTGPGPGE